MKAKLTAVRVAPRKMGWIIDQIRGKDINEALTFLKMSPRKNAAGVVYGVLKSAVANADQKGTVDVDTLYVKTIMVGEGPILHRWRARAKGSASPIRKRTSHLYVELAEK